MNGISENAVSSTIDWLSYTVQWTELRRNDWVTHDGQHVAVASLTKIRGDWRRDIPLHGYEDCWTCADGGNARVMVSRPGSAMGVHVQLPGQALAKQGCETALHICRELMGSVTRIDFAVDVRGVSEASDVYGALIAKTAITRAQKHNMMIGNGGVTVYIGSRSSERFLRVYDKAAQTKTEGNWTRIELECKGDKAKWLTKLVGQEGFDAIGAIINDYVSCPGVDWYHDALTRTKVTLGAPQPKKMTDTRAWLLGTVAKTLAKETKEDDDFLTDFLRTVMRLRSVSGEGEE